MTQEFGILIKFVEEKYVPTTLNGNLFFSSSTYFRDHEAKYKVEGIGDVNDPYESSDRYTMKADKVYLYLKAEKRLITLSVNKVNMTFKTVKPYGICSFMYLNLNNDFEEDLNIDTTAIKKDIKISYSNLKVMRLKTDVITQLKTFQKVEEKNKKSKCIPLLFTNDLSNALNNRKDVVMSAPVNYHDFHKLVNTEEIPNYNRQSDVSVLFGKDISYKGQREYRMVKSIQKNVKGEEVSFPELKGKISQLSIEKLEQIRLIMVYE